MKKKKGVPSLDDYHLLEVAGHLMRRGQQRAAEFYMHEVGEDGPTPRQFAVLITVGQNPGINQTGLVNITGIDRSTIGELLGRLTRHGWLRRRRTTTDARSNALYVTAAGRAVVEETIPKALIGQRKIVASIPVERRAEFLKYLRLFAGLSLPDRSDTKADPE